MDKIREVPPHPNKFLGQDPANAHADGSCLHGQCVATFIDHGNSQFVRPGNIEFSNSISRWKHSVKPCPTKLVWPKRHGCSGSGNDITFLAFASIIVASVRFPRLGNIAARSTDETLHMRRWWLCTKTLKQKIPPLD
jgi:hypothetical protein